jgi:peroxiredoxin
MELVERVVRSEAEAQAALAQVQQGEGDGILKPNSLSLNIPGFILETTMQRGLPSMFDDVGGSAVLYSDRDGSKSMCETRGARAPTRRVLVWGLVGLVLMLAPPALSQPTLAELLRALNLSAYPAGLWPPPFTGQTATGQAVSLAALQGRVVLVTFWASWCAECRPEMPMFERLHQDFAAQGLTVLGINFREEPQRMQQYARDLGLTFALVLDPQGEISRAYGVIGLPTTFLVGRDGRPVALAIGPRAWESAEARTLIQALLAESVVK